MPSRGPKGNRMFNVRKLASAVALVALLGACAGRDAAYIPIVQPTDQGVDCGALYAEMSANTAKIASLSDEEGNKRGQNRSAPATPMVMFWARLLPSSLDSEAIFAVFADISA